MTTYHGYRLQQLDTQGVPTTMVCKVVVRDDAGERELPQRQDLHNHSPTGLEWGYLGSGPAQLALAILADCLTKSVALRYYQRFKWLVVGALPHDGWTLTKDQVVNAICDLMEQERATDAGPGPGPGSPGGPAPAARPRTGKQTP